MKKSDCEMRLFWDWCVDSAPFVASNSGRILIRKPQVIFLSIPANLELSDSSTGTNVSFIESQPHRVAMLPTPMTASAQPIDRAEELLRIQSWDQVRERRYQTIRVLHLLMEVHDRANEHLSRLTTHSAPLLHDDNTQIMGPLFLTAEEVPALVTDEDDGLTDRDAEGEVDMGED